MHNQRAVTKILTPKPLPIIKEQDSRKRGRKPDKNSICHVLPTTPEEPEVIIHEDDAIDTSVTGTPLNHSIEEPEVTITPTGGSKTDSSTALLKPEEYHRFGMPAGYIFWPVANMFVHPR